MASATALQLVNRVRRKRRYPDVSSFEASDIQTTIILDLLNQSIRELIDGEHWGFETIHEGIFVTRRSFPLGHASVIRGSTAVEFAAQQDDDEIYVTSALFGGSVSSSQGQGQEVDPEAPYPSYRLILNDSGYPNTSWPVSGIYETQAVGGIPPFEYTGVLGIEWPGASGTYTTGEIVAYEYVLDSHRKIRSARCEETPLDVIVADSSDFGTDRRLVRPWETKGDPEILFVGGTATRNSNSDTFDKIGLRLSVWPCPPLDETATETIPQTTYAPRGPIIHYTYSDESAALAAAADVLSFTTDKAVPALVEDLIVDLAVAKGLQGPLESDYEAGYRMELTVLAKAARFRKTIAPAQSVRNVLRPLDRSQNRGDGSWGFGRLPRNVGSD